MKTDRVILAPGPEEELRVIRMIYGMVSKSKRGCAEIARLLNGRGITRYVKPWQDSTVLEVLTNPKYAGHNVWYRTSKRLGSHPGRVPSENWVVKQHAFVAAISQRTFDRAQKRIRRVADRLWSDEKIVDRLKSLLAAKGKLTERLIKSTPGMPHQHTVRHRFGSCRHSYRLAGYELPKRNKTAAAKYVRGQRLRRELMERIATMFPGRITTFRSSGLRYLLKLDDDIPVSVLFCRMERTRTGYARWVVQPVPSERNRVTLVCLLNRKGDAVRYFYVFPRIDLLTLHKITSSDPWLKTGRSLHDLSEFCEAVRASVLL